MTISGDEEELMVVVDRRTQLSRWGACGGVALLLWGLFALCDEVVAVGILVRATAAAAHAAQPPHTAGGLPCSGGTLPRAGCRTPRHGTAVMAAHPLARRPAPALGK